MKNKKLLLLLFATGTVLTGCSKKEVELEYIEPAYTSSELKERINNEGYQKVIEKLGYFDVESLTLSGIDLSNIAIENLKGEVVKLSDFKGKKVVILGLLSDCKFSKELVKDQIPSYQENNEDVIILHMFSKGTKDEVEKFYEDLDYDEQYIFSGESTHTLFNNPLKVSGYPSVIFVDEEGKTRWHFSGLTNSETIQTHHEIAYENDFVKDYVSPELLEDIRRDYETIRNELSNEVINKVNTLKEEHDHLFDNAIYSSLGKEVLLDVIKDSSDKELNFKEVVKNKILVNRFSEYNADNMKVLKEIKEKNPNITIINLASEGTKTDIEYTDFLFIESPEKRLGVFEELPLYEESTLYFVDQNSKIAGVLTNNYSIDKYKKAEEIFFGEVPVYAKVVE